jgi:hypothetical protein
MKNLLLQVEAWLSNQWSRLNMLWDYQAANPGVKITVTSTKTPGLFTVGHTATKQEMKELKALQQEVLAAGGTFEQAGKSLTRYFNLPKK